MKLGSKPTEISREVGGTFTILVDTSLDATLNRPERAHRAGMARRRLGAGCLLNCEVVLVEQGSGRRLVFDHTGFPKAGRTFGVGMDGNTTGSL